jgi:NTE family protein
VVGAAYAAGKLDVLEAVGPRHQLATRTALTDFQLGGNGVLEGRAIEQELRRHFGRQRIEDLPCPSPRSPRTCVTGRAWTATEGDLVSAVRASISLPAVFEPVRSATNCSWTAAWWRMCPLPRLTPWGRMSCWRRRHRGL